MLTINKCRSNDFITASVYPQRNCNIKMNAGESHPVYSPLEYFYLEYGDVIVLTGESSVKIEPKSFWVCGAACTVTASSEAELKCISIYRLAYERIILGTFDDNTAKLDLHRITPIVCILNDQSWGKSVFDHICKMSECSSTKYELNIINLVVSTAKEIADSNDADVSTSHASARYVEEARRYINAHSSEQIKADEIAAHIHVHPAYLQRLFKRETGTTIGAYMSSCRMEEAKHMLAMSDISISDIADKVGINGRQYFFRLFRKYTGMTPNEFRKIHRDEISSPK